MALILQLTIQLRYDTIETYQTIIIRESERYMKLFTITATPVRVDVSENENRRRVDNYPELVSKIMALNGFDGFTMYQVNGYWQGKAEASFKIEVAVDNNPERAYIVAETLRDIYKQDAVMVTLPNNSVRFV